MEEMKTIYTVGGTLSRGFIGQISYTVCLEESYDELDIAFSFSPKHFKKGDVSEEYKSYLKKYCEEEYGFVPSSEEECDEALYHEMKTEIHTLATLNDEFIGGIHRQLTSRNMYFSKEEASLGCIPVSPIQGVLKVTLLAFTVLLDNTEYTLTVKARKN